MIKIKVLYNKNGCFAPGAGEWQDKTFKEEDIAVAWCIKNAPFIGCINVFRTNFGELTRDDVINAINGMAR